MKAEEILIYLRKSRSDNPEETVEEVLARHERQLQDEAVPPKEKNRLLKQIIQRIDYSRDSTNRTRWDTSKPVLEIHFKEF